jgi:hypothetical protein
LNGSGCGTDQVDLEYLDAVSRAVPRQGVAFTYSHFPPEHWAHLNGPRRTVINWSAPSPEAAARCVADRVAPAVAVVPRVGFTAHGSGARKAEMDTPGGCYADTGHAGIQWARTGTARASTINTGAGCVPCESEVDALERFVEQLPRGTKLRHHVAGDLGKSTP